MPRLCLDTNLPVSKINQDFLSGSLTLLSNILDKDSQFCLTTVNADLKMTLCKSNEPCGIVEIMCIGNLGPKENKTHISIITNYIYQKLGIPKDRLLVFFHSNTYEGAGYLGTTLHHLYCQK